MQEVIFRVRKTDDHGRAEGRRKVEIATLPKVGEHVMLDMIAPDPSRGNIRNLRQTQTKAGVIVEKINSHAVLDEEDIMAPFSGTIVDCRWA